MVTIEQFRLKANVSFITPTSRSYRPSSWPPPRDWVCFEDGLGNVLSRWGDPTWCLDAWAGKPARLNFGDGSGDPNPIDPANANILRLLATCRIWGPRGLRAASSITFFFTPIRAIVALCSREGILASDLSRFPAVVEMIPRVLAKSTYRHAITELQWILDMQDILGFTLLNQSGLKQLIAVTPAHNTEQTEYIPPRIWAYQRERLHECLEDYQRHQQQVEACFHFCVDAYVRNYGSLIQAIVRPAKSSKGPFNKAPRTCIEEETNCKFYGHFAHTAHRFGIAELLTRWVGKPEVGGRGLKLLSAYFKLIQVAGVAYILNFSLMRRDEGWNLHTDCFREEDDEKLGKIYMICGETTKTDPDSDARWPVNQSTKLAVDVLTSIAHMRMRCAIATPGCSPSQEDIANPYLINRAFEPWVRKPVCKPYRIRSSGIRSYHNLVIKFPLLFDLKELCIQQEDLNIALAVCPTLNPDVYQVGKMWHFGFHQLRRTGAVNMFSSGIVSDSTIQYQLKHKSRYMTLYYGRGSSTLTLNEDLRKILVNTQYEIMGKEISAVLSDRFVSPYGEEHKKQNLVGEVLGITDINLLEEKDARFFESAARKGNISFRATVLGACMKNGKCDGDCIESIADCSGSTGQSPCRDVLFDRKRSHKNKIRLNSIKQQLKSTSDNSPLYRALDKERLGLENYFAYINRGW